MKKKLSLANMSTTDVSECANWLGSAGNAKDVLEVLRQKPLSCLDKHVPQLRLEWMRKDGREHHEHVKRALKRVAGSTKDALTSAKERRHREEVKKLEAVGKVVLHLPRSLKEM